MQTHFENGGTLLTGKVICEFSSLVGPCVSQDPITYRDEQTV